MKKDKYFRCTNLNLAIFLYANDQQISGISPITSDQKEFAFIKSDYLDELVWLYKFGEKEDERLMVSVHKYERSRRELLDKLLND